MKILFVLENYLPHLGGVEVVFKNLCEGLVRQGFEVTILTHKIKGTASDEVLDGVKVHRVRSLGSRIMFSFCAIMPAFRYAKHADIIHTTAFNGAPPGWIAAKLRRKPVIIHVHEVWIGMWDKVTSMSWISAKIHNLLEKMIYLLPFTRYVCVSESTKRQLIRQNIQKEKVQVILNGYEEGFFDPKKYDGKKIRKGLDIDDKFVLFSWGRPGVSKGHDFAVLAMNVLKKTMPDARLVLMLGQKDKYKKRFDYLMDLIRKNDLERQVIVVPSAPYKELGNYLKAADCIIVPSLSEGFGYTTLEACEMNKPVIATDNASIPEVIWGKYILVPPRDPDAIAEAVIKAKEKKYLERKKRSFPWKSNIDDHIRMYKSLVKRT